ncbi:MAG: PP2C family protein-serine/threonine phosphatase [Chthoniobacteraceae bacterium]
MKTTNTPPIQLPKELNLFNFLIENTPDQIYFKDLEGRFIYVSNAVAAGFGVTDSREIVGKTDSELLGEELARDAARDEQRIIDTGEPLVGKIEKWSKANGRVLWNHTTKLPLRNALGKIIGICGVNKDITALHEAETALIQERNNLRAIAEELHARNVQIQADLQMARELQEALLPQPDSFNGSARISFTHSYRPAAAVGGDFFHIFPISQTLAGVFICDVMGHGMRAAFITAIIRGLLEQLRPNILDAGGFMNVLNGRLCSILRRVEEPIFATAIYMLLDEERHEVQFANAGHPEPFFLGMAANGVKSLNASGNKPGAALGLFDDAIYSTKRYRLGEGDRVILFTDGLYEVEAPSGDVFSQTKLRSSFEKHWKLPTAELFDAVTADVCAFSQRSSFDDDVCIVAGEFPSH